MKWPLDSVADIWPPRCVDIFWAKSLCMRRPAHGRTDEPERRRRSQLHAQLGTQSLYGERFKHLLTHLVAAATQIARDMGAALPSEVKEVAAQFAHKR